MLEMLSIENFGIETIIAGFLYVTLSLLYLVIIPAGIYFYLHKRWYIVSSFERAFLYFLVFLFFPGMLLLSPFLNTRPARRSINS